jgi:hypothetical protein
VFTDRDKQAIGVSLFLMSGKHPSPESAVSSSRLLIVTSPSLTLLRQLFPSWEFFDVARLPPTLQFRLLPDEGEPGAWHDVVRPAPRRWWHLLFNPAGTQTLAAQTLVEQWYTELVEQGEESAVCQGSLQLVTALSDSVRRERQSSGSAAPAGWQLRLIVIDESGSAPEVVYESDRLTSDSAPSTP